MNNQTNGWHRRAYNEWIQRHKVLTVIISFLLMTAILQIPKVIAHAETGDPLVNDSDPMLVPAGIPIDSSICLPSGSPDLQCLWSIPTEVSKFRAGFFKHAHGLDTDLVFTRPAMVRQTFQDQIQPLITNGNRANLYAKYDPVPHVCQTDSCLAFKMYDSMMSDASCATKGKPTNLANTCVRAPQQMTQQDVFGAVDVILCGVAIAAVVVATDGAGIALAVGGAGGACVWALWRDIAFP